RDSGGDPWSARSVDEAARQRRGAAGLALVAHERVDPGDPVALLGARVLGRRRALDGHGLRRRRVERGPRVSVPEAGRRDRVRDRADRRSTQSGDLVAGGARRAGAAARPVVVDDVELVPLVDALGVLGPLAELYPDVPPAEWRRAIGSSTRSGSRPTRGASPAP